MPLIVSGKERLQHHTQDSLEGYVVIHLCIVEMTEKYNICSFAMMTFSSRCRTAIVCQQTQRETRSLCSRNVFERRQTHPGAVSDVVAVHGRELLAILLDFSGPSCLR